jgi:DNA polymerase-3 subunit epsilon
MDRCLAPCDGSVDLDTYALMVADVRDNLLRRADAVVEAIAARMRTLAAEQRYEDAGVHRDRLASFVRAASRTQRLSALTGCAELIAARREDDGRWAVHVIRFGRLAGAGVIPPDAHAREYVDQLRLTSETVSPGLGPTPAATAEETEKILRWLESPGLRLVDVEGEWACPVRGASRHLAAHDAVEQSRLSLVPFDERRSLPTVHQPAR